MLRCLRGRIPSPADGLRTFLRVLWCRRFGLGRTLGLRGSTISISISLAINPFCAIKPCCDTTGVPHDQDLVGKAQDSRFHPLVSAR